MPNSANRSYRYPARNESSRYGWRNVQQLAEDVDADMAAQVSAIAALDAEVNALQAAGLGRIGSNNITANLSANSATEQVGSTYWITFTNPSTARRYRMIYSGAYQSTVAGDVIAMRGRWLAGASLTSGGTQFKVIAFHCSPVLAFGTLPMVFIAEVTGLSVGQVSIGLTIARPSGTGTISLIGSVGSSEGTLILDDVGT